MELANMWTHTQDDRCDHTLDYGVLCIGLFEHSVKCGYYGAACRALQVRRGAEMHISSSYWIGPRDPHAECDP